MRMRWMRARWFFGVIAPWSLAMGLTMSFAADAGQDITLSASVAFITSPSFSQPVDLVGGQAIERLARLGLSAAWTHGEIQVASLNNDMDLAARARAQETENQPKPTLKRKMEGRDFPAVDRTNESDAFVALRPALSKLLNATATWVQASQKQWLFNTDNSGRATELVQPVLDDSALKTASHFTPWMSGESPIVTKRSAAQSETPHSLIVYGPHMRRVQLEGATPKISRSTVLASTTPVALDAMPVMITAASLDPAFQRRTVLQANHQPDYEQLIQPDKVASEEHCLAQAIYFEARSETQQGQAAVAQVIFNRVKSGLYPTSVCGVVFQNRQMHNACQFSFACNGQSLAILEPYYWHQAVDIAKKVTDGQTYIAKLGDATHYHANYVRPRWARSMKKMDVIGHHIFYKPRAGQT